MKNPGTSPGKYMIIGYVWWCGLYHQDGRTGKKVFMDFRLRFGGATRIYHNDREGSPNG